MVKTETKATVSEKQAADLLGLNRATLRYYRTNGYLVKGLVLPPDETGLVPPGRTSPLRYDADLVAEIAAKRVSLFSATARK